MTHETKPAVIALALCAALDFIAAPALLAASGSDGPPAIVGITTGLFGILTVIAAVGLARGRAWAAPLAIVVRAIDALTALPGLGQGAGPAVAVAVTVVLSAVAIVLVVRARRAIRTTTPSPAR
jgi:hypothetical protein